MILLITHTISEFCARGKSHAQIHLGTHWGDCAPPEAGPVIMLANGCLLNEYAII